jgi:tetratricopeptide (TPR) repeat protein
MKLLRCELRAQSPGYRSSSVRFDSGQISGYTEVHNILIYPSERVQGTSVSVTSLLAPKNAKKSIERASKALRKDKFSEAEAILKSSIQSYAKNAEAWYLLGQAYQLQLRTKDARESYEKAIDLDSRYVRPYLPLARLALSERNWKASADLSNRALELDPIAFPEAYFLNALSQYHLEELVLAEKSARRGERLDFSNQYPQMHLLLANILAKRHDQGGSLEELRRYLKIAPNAKDAPLVRSQVQEKGKLVKAASK